MKAVHRARAWVRSHKHVVHAFVLVTIAVSLATDGAKPADAEFLLLSLLCELD